MLHFLIDFLYFWMSALGISLTILVVFFGASFAYDVVYRFWGSEPQPLRLLPEAQAVAGSSREEAGAQDAGSRKGAKWKKSSARAAARRLREAQSGAQSLPYPTLMAHRRPRSVPCNLSAYSVVGHEEVDDDSARSEGHESRRISRRLTASIPDLESPNKLKIRLDAAAEASESIYSRKTLGSFASPSNVDTDWPWNTLAVTDRQKECLPASRDLNCDSEECIPVDQKYVMEMETNPALLATSQVVSAVSETIQAESDTPTYSDSETTQAVSDTTQEDTQEESETTETAVEISPTDSESSQARLQSTQAGSVTSSSLAETNPLLLEATPAETKTASIVNSTPEVPESAPGVPNRTPLMTEFIPLGMKSARTGLTTAHLGRETTPGGWKSILEGRETIPLGRETVGAVWETTTVGQETTQMGRETVPVGRETTPVGWETTPVGRETTHLGWEATPVGWEATPVGWETTPIRRANAHMGGIPPIFPPVGETTPVGREDTHVGRETTVLGRVTVPVESKTTPIVRENTPRVQENRAVLPFTAHLGAVPTLLAPVTTHQVPKTVPVTSETPKSSATPVPNITGSLVPFENDGADLTTISVPTNAAVVVVYNTTSETKSSNEFSLLSSQSAFACLEKNQLLRANSVPAPTNGPATIKGTSIDRIISLNALGNKILAPTYSSSRSADSRRRNSPSTIPGVCIQCIPSSHYFPNMKIVMSSTVPSMRIFTPKTSKNILPVSNQNMIQQKEFNMDTTKTEEKRTAQFISEKVIENTIIDQKEDVPVSFKDKPSICKEISSNDHKGKVSPSSTTSPQQLKESSPQNTEIGKMKSDDGKIKARKTMACKPPVLGLPEITKSFSSPGQRFRSLSVPPNVSKAMNEHKEIEPTTITDRDFARPNVSVTHDGLSAPDTIISRISFLRTAFLRVFSSRWS